MGEREGGGQGHVPGKEMFSHKALLIFNGCL